MYDWAPELLLYCTVSYLGLLLFTHSVYNHIISVICVIFHVMACISASFDFILRITRSQTVEVDVNFTSSNSNDILQYRV